MLQPSMAKQGQLSHQTAGPMMVPNGKLYGPEISVQSIRSIDELEAVYVSYTDLLQGKSTRKMEMWRKYRFNCECKRCDETSISYADDILKKIGLCGGSTEMSALEGWLLEEAQRGITQFFHYDNPWSCCEILECALEQLVQEALGGFSLRQNQTQNVKQPTVHLMHRICLDMYMALSSSYRVVGAQSEHLDEGKHLSCFEGCLRGESESHECKSRITEARAAVNRSMASAGYTLIVAGAIQHLFESGEHGLIASTAWSWLHTGEAFIRLIFELDNHFLVNTPKTFPEQGTQSYEYYGSCHPSELKGTCGILCTENSVGEFDQPCRSKNTTDFVTSLRHLMDFVWPLIRGSSPFLSSIVNPLDLSIITVKTSITRIESLETDENWKHYRNQILMCSSCCLQYSKYLMEICYGYTDPLVAAAQNLLCVVLTS